MTYPCIVYAKTGKLERHSNDKTYSSIQEYQLTVIDRNPDGTTADDINDSFKYSRITRYYVVDNLNHTTLDLKY